MNRLPQGEDKEGRGERAPAAPAGRRTDGAAREVERLRRGRGEPRATLSPPLFSQSSEAVSLSDPFSQFMPLPFSQ